MNISQYIFIFLRICGGLFSDKNRENVYAKIRDTKYDINDKESL